MPDKPEISQPRSSLSVPSVPPLRDLCVESSPALPPQRLRAPYFILYIVIRYVFIDSTIRHALVCNRLTPFGPYASLRWGASIGFLRGRQFDHLGFFCS